MLYYQLLPPYVTKRIRPNGQEFLCQFQDTDTDSFVNDCSFKDLFTAMSYLCLVVRFVVKVAEGKILDTKAKQAVFACQKLVDLSTTDPFTIQEAQAGYGQLTIFNGEETNHLAKRRKLVEGTLAKLNQLHDALNSQLYSRPTERPAVHSPQDAYAILKSFMEHLDHEELWIVDLDTRNRVMSLVTLYKGSVNQSQVRVSEVFRQAIIENAPGIILAHNHPSGDPSPSPEDISLTRAVVATAKLLDIEVIDHLVIGFERFVSLKEKGLGF